MPSLQVTTNNYITSNLFDLDYELINKPSYTKEYLQSLVGLLEYASYSNAYKRPTAYFIRITPAKPLTGDSYTQIINCITKEVKTAKPLYFAKAESNTKQDGLHFHMLLVVDREQASPQAINSTLKKSLKSGLISSHRISVGSEHKLNLMYPLGWRGLQDTNKTSIELYKTKSKPNLIANAVYLAGYIAKVDTTATQADIRFQPIRTNFKNGMLRKLKDLKAA